MSELDPKREQANGADSPLAGRREWLGLAVLALACVLYSMDLTVLHLAVPAISADLEPTSAQLLWIVDIYGFMLAGSLLTMGTLGDRIGRRRLLLIGAFAFAAASLLAAFSTTAEMLIVSRALLGIAGATLAPSTLSLIRSMFHDARQRTTAIGVWITAFAVGAVIGPPIGGVLLEYFWWGSVFLLALPVMALLLAIGPILLPEYRDPDAGRLDLVSAALSLGAVLAAIYGLKRVALDGLEPVQALSIVAGMVLGVIFVHRQRRLADPLLDLRLFRVTAFSASLATYLLATFLLFAIFLFIYQYLQLVAGFSPLAAAAWGMPSAGAFIVGAMLTPPIAQRVSPGYVIATGLLIAAGGYGLLSLVEVGSSVALVVASSIVFSLGLAPAFTLTTDLVVGSAPVERAGSASAISETSSELGGALGIAILGSVAAAIYRDEMAQAVPAGVPADATAVAQDTLGGAVEVGSALPSSLGAELLDAARESFTQGLQVAAVSSAAIAAGTALMAAVLLRHIRPSASSETESVHESAVGFDLEAERAV
ncbi:MAG TPA: MFS transporter [Gaiellaceae bacterium]|nr:MFS transporter [Gaiellaceae bacterium]